MPGVHPQPGEDPPVLRVGEAVPVGGAFATDEPVSGPPRARRGCGGGCGAAAPGARGGGGGGGGGGRAPAVTITGPSGSSPEPVNLPGPRGRPVRPRATGPVISLWRAVVISDERPGLTAGIHSRSPRRSVRARNSSPWTSCSPPQSGRFAVPVRHGVPLLEELGEGVRTNAPSGRTDPPPLAAILA